ncbi:hypothetical protein FEAC_29880 [Ferrimicrobium acidiphilum DSM 19497]|uniref:Uncharacterized protein n=1 Tax=Ferrimicrobium acidiphilum DSM 19497 TaxID=1121877 RepID=A0A0D8FQ78_9ACTN|nr:hypothetical protein [Ferrimicrobium acidiphilum]KJE75291.1 hypothetical protein FEAC_29880 [Ferrimicrobium acidiphilum DSM 19497]
MKVRNVIRGGAVVAASAALVSVGGGMGLTAAHSSSRSSLGMSTMSSNFTVQGQVGAGSTSTELPNYIR